MKQKPLILVAALILVAVGLFVVYQGKKKAPESDTTSVTTTPGVVPVMIIETAKGSIEIEMFPAEAPKTVARITELVKQGFYDGLVFHRVVDGFVVQGGDPTGSGMGGSGQKLPAEFNQHKHVPGAVAMARASDPNSADSQFYITLGTHPHLDGNYTVFGKVVKGMEFASALKQGDKMLRITMKP